MSPTVIDRQLNPASQFYQAPIGKKVVMAITGVVLFGFVVGHMLGNLQVFLGPEKLNAYGAALHNTPALLWGTRIILLVAVALHIVASIQLAALKKSARPVDYVKRKAIESSYASRTMMWSGPIIAAFVIYHLMHFTFGTAHPDFRIQSDGISPDAYHNVIAGFRSIPVSLAYIVSMALLGMHLYHGLWSMFQSLGAGHPRYTPSLKRFAALATAVIVAGNISIPVAVLLGVIS